MTVQSPAIGCGPSMRALTVYARAYCHLCDEMIDALAALPGAERVAVHVVDVDADPALEARYGERVPVLVGADGRELCHYRLDPEAVAAYLAPIG